MNYYQQMSLKIVDQIDKLQDLMELAKQARDKAMQKSLLICINELEGLLLDLARRCEKLQQIK